MSKVNNEWEWRIKTWKKRKKKDKMRFWWRKERIKNGKIVNENVKNLIQEEYGVSKKHIKEQGKEVNGKKNGLMRRNLKEKYFWGKTFEEIQKEKYV